MQTATLVTYNCCLFRSHFCF